MFSVLKMPSLPVSLAFLLLISAPATVHPAPAPWLEAARSFPVGSGPYGMASGDLNGDGFPDVVTANFNVSDVSLLYGAGDGTFDTKPSIPIDGIPFGIALGRLDDDANLDIVVAAIVNVAVLVADGAGGFKKTAYYAVDNAGAVAVGDVTGDGIADLVTGNVQSNTASVLIGNGDGSFQDADYAATGDYAGAVAVGDLDGDGKSEFVIANGGDGTISVFRYHGGGGSTRVDYFVGSAPNDVAIGDLNGDGKLDVAVPCLFSHSVRVLLNDGTGVLQPAQPYLTDEFPASVAIADINGDEIPDLVTTNEIYAMSLSVLLGTGTGRFLDKVDTGVGTPAHGIAIGNFDEDNKVDLATASQQNDAVFLFTGDGAGGFTARRDRDVGAEPRFIAMGDLNGDALVDLVTANDVSNNVTVLLNREGEWSRIDYPADLGPMAVALGDVSGDGQVDVVTGNWRSNNLSVLLGNGDGTLRSRTNWGTVGSPFAVAIADLNHDEKLDVVTGNRSGGGGEVAVLLGRGDGTFHPAVLYGTAGPSYGVVVGDVNGDAHADIVAANYTSGVTVLLGNGSGTFRGDGVYPVPGLARGVAMSDLNGDGHQDVITANTAGHNVAVLLGNGTGKFPTVVTYGVSYSPTHVAAGDLTGDGHMDIAVANTGTSVVSVLSGLGDGTFAPRTDFAASLNPHCVAIGDVDGDGRSDLVSANVSAYTVSILRNMGAGSDPPPPIPPTTTAVEAEATTLPQSFGMRLLGPNPAFHGDARIELALPTAAPVQVRIYNVRGSLVRSLMQRTLTAGRHPIRWDGRTASGSPASSGVYFVQMTAQGKTYQTRVALIR